MFITILNHFYNTIENINNVIIDFLCSEDSIKICYMYNFEKSLYNINNHFNEYINDIELFFDDIKVEDSIQSEEEFELCFEEELDDFELLYIDENKNYQSDEDEFIICNNRENFQDDFNKEFIIENNILDDYIEV